MLRISHTRILLSARDPASRRSHSVRVTLWLSRPVASEAVRLLAPAVFTLRLKTAGPPGLEPGTVVLETTVLPLNYRPIFRTVYDTKYIGVRNAGFSYCVYAVQ